MKKKIKLNESKLKSVIDRVINEEFSDATTFNKSLWVIVPNAALKDIKSKGGLFPYNGGTSVVTKGVYLCNDKNAIQAYSSPNSSYVEVDFGKLMSSLRGTRNANIQKRDFNGAITYIVPYVPSDCISSVEPCGRGGQLQEEKHLNKLTESDLHRIVKESVRKMLKENTANVESQFADIITGLDAQSASFIAGELARAGQETIGAMTFIIEHFNGYGYGGPDVNGNMVNNKNYVFDPSTRTGIDRTMGHDIKFRYTGNDLENFTNLLRRSDGDDFNPDWLESWGGVEFDDI